jgi:lysophospholipid acyltransferase (LPLAT)-like uncharacterized protein
MIVPIPFTRAIFLYGDPITIGRHDDVESARLRLEDALNRLADESEQQFEELWGKG